MEVPLITSPLSTRNEDELRAKASVCARLYENLISHPRIHGLGIIGVSTKSDFIHEGRSLVVW